MVGWLSFFSVGGALLFPVDSITRETAAEQIPAADTPVLVYCRSGLRSYIACRILTGEGFHCYNLAGGYRLYQSVTGEGKPPVSAMPCKK